MPKAIILEASNVNEGKVVGSDILSAGKKVDSLERRKWIDIKLF